MDGGDISSDLLSFRDDWKKELNHQRDESLPAQRNVDEPKSDTSVESTPRSLPYESSVHDVSPFPFQFTDSLLRSWQETPPSQAGKRRCSGASLEPGDKSAGGTEDTKRGRLSLVDIFIEDLNELDDIPFFDMSLPREIAVKIFSFLKIKDLCSCSQVSKAWSGIANDNLIWERIYHQAQSTFSGHTKVSSSSNWKHTTMDCYIKSKALLSNWKEHKCHTTYYHHARGGILTSAHCLDDTVVAGYTNGQVRTWNIITHSSQTFEPSNKSLLLLDEDAEDSLGTSENSVTCVKLGLNSQIIAGYKHGQVQMWNHSDPESMVVCDFPEYCVGDVIAGVTFSYISVNHRSGNRCLIKVLSVSDTGIQVADEINIRGEEETWTLPKYLMSPLHSPSTDSPALIYLTRDSINIHKSTKELYKPTRHTSSKLEEFYATHFTCLETSQRYVSLGFTSHLGLQAEYKIRLYDPNSLKVCSDLRGHTSQVTCIDSSFLTGYIIATGCHDRRVRLYDTRLPTAAVHTYMGHPASVQCIQSDEWKVVSGDQEGYICVWDQRMGSKYWESQSRHPVKYLKFSCNHLVSANIPLQASDEQFDCDRMTHLRYRGRLQVGDFSGAHSSTAIPSICSSSYDIPEASNYNLSLITPYDSI